MTIAAPIATTDRPTSDFDDGRVMLTLAMLSYRGFLDLRPGHLALGHLRRVISDGLETLEPLRGRWRLVWGPAAYQAPFTLFDENVMYVVRSTDPPPTFVVAVRGTNPISTFDWLFGDLWAGVLTPWRFGADAPEAAISLSTALGLSVLCHLRSPGPDPSAAGAVWRVVDERLGDPMRGAVRTLARPAGSLLSTALRRAGMDFRADLRELRHRREELAGVDPAERVAGMLAMRFSEPAQRIYNLVKAVDETVGERPHQAVLGMMEGSLHLRTRLAPGTTLFRFLADQISEVDDATVVVTGHSKGGALSSTLALALAQSQGAAPSSRRWDPDNKATVHCWSFAGPTAGNRPFAELSDRVLGTRCHRVFNRLDIVPHAWIAADPDHPEPSITDVPDLYGGEVHRIPGLDRLAAAIAADVGPLGYRHLRADARMLPGVVAPDRTLFLDQVAYQHMEAYLEMMGLGEFMDVDTFFGPAVA